MGMHFKFKCDKCSAPKDYANCSYSSNHNTEWEVQLLYSFCQINVNVLQLPAVIEKSVLTYRSYLSHLVVAVSASLCVAPCPPCSLLRHRAMILLLPQLLSNGYTALQPYVRYPCNHLFLHTFDLPCLDS